MLARSAEEKRHGPVLAIIHTLPCVSSEDIKGLSLPTSSLSHCFCVLPTMVPLRLAAMVKPRCCSVLYVLSR